MALYNDEKWGNTIIILGSPTIEKVLLVPAASTRARHIAPLRRQISIADIEPPDHFIAGPVRINYSDSSTCSPDTDGNVLIVETVVVIHDITNLSTGSRRVIVLSV
jgi:hypothetical protein